MIVTNNITIIGTKLKPGRISHLTNCRKASGKPPIDWPLLWTKAMPAVDSHRP